MGTVETLAIWHSAIEVAGKCGPDAAKYAATLVVVYHKTILNRTNVPEESKEEPRRSRALGNEGAIGGRGQNKTAK